MCCFSFDGRRHRDLRLAVKATHIFARGLPDGRQYLVYAMDYASPVEVAMILPLPTPPGPAEDAVEFIDLSGYPEFFRELDGGFPPDPDEPRRTGMLSSRARTLEVHGVGSFEASFVPSPKDFARLDARFRMPEGALERLPQYGDYGFAVFKLKQGALKVHPMAFSFPRRRRDELFFPTVHVHDGTVPAEAAFDHKLYCQRARPAETGEWRTSCTWSRRGWPEMSEAQRKARLDFLLPFCRDEAHALEVAKAYGMSKATQVPARAFMDCARAKGIVAADSTVERRVLRGWLPNVDTAAPAA